ncbi:MAG: hypothetical protein HY257_05220 [Chloroflexi bacterium]|nr:hypothetical protein [Chloroflexota bacterium]
MFDLEKIKRESGLPRDVLARLEAKVKAEFRDDAMMFELHFVRVITAIKQGTLSLDQAFAEPVPA